MTYSICLGPPLKPKLWVDFLTEVIGGESSKTWKIYVDGSATKKGSGVGVLLCSPQGETLHLAVKLQFWATNNEAEYEALLTGLQAAQHVGATRVVVHSDSQLVDQQIKGTFEIRNDRLKRYAEAVENLKAQFQEVTLQKIPRADNHKADELAKLASALTTWETIDPMVQEQLIAQIDQAPQSTRPEDWQTPIISFLTQGILPEDPEQARILKRRATRFTMIGETLFKRAFSRPLLKCLNPEEADYVMREIHQGCCGNHIGGRTLVRKILLAGYFWPTMQADADQLVRTCLSCQKHQTMSHQPTELLKTSSVSCPFDQWGMDIVGPFPLGPGQKKFLLVAVDYFSKWVEVEPLAHITEKNVLKFLWQNIVCRFGIPRKLVSDNGRQFQGQKIKEWCEGLKIQQAFTSVYYPQSNGQTEVVNRELVRGLKTKLDHVGGSWVDELPDILWAYRTTPRDSTGLTPFHLVYGGEVVVPVEIGCQSVRVEAYDDAEDNVVHRATELDLITETREKTSTRLDVYRRRMGQMYNRRV
ncbi:uncharacterized protein LOC141812118 [Curcuma longa]|uniref:uncharacterized protein LOC141812118 n=1 Tax=Curcuma longa TaxID=136217 RepID=UPI003D9E42AF